MSRLARLIALSACLATGNVLAAEPVCYISYANFEEKVPHMDLDACPGNDPAPEDGFCRIALHGAEVLIYVMRHTEAGPCLVRIDRSDFNAFVARNGVTYRKP